MSDEINDPSFYKKCATILVEEGRNTDINILISALEEENENVGLIISNILYEVALVDHSLIENDVNSLIKICSSEKELLYNNSLRILVVIVPSKHKIIFKNLLVISDVFIKGGDDVKDSFVMLLLALIQMSPDYQMEICNTLLAILEFYPQNNFAAYAKKILPVIDNNKLELFQKKLIRRKDDLKIEDQKEVDEILSHILLKMPRKN